MIQNRGLPVFPPLYTPVADQFKEMTLLTTLAVGLILVLGAVLGISMGGVNAYAGFGLLVTVPLLIGDIFLARSLIKSRFECATNRQSQKWLDRLEGMQSYVADKASQLAPGQCYWPPLTRPYTIVKHDDGSVFIYAFLDYRDQRVLNAHYENKEHIDKVKAAHPPNTLALSPDSYRFLPPLPKDDLSNLAVRIGDGPIEYKCFFSWSDRAEFIWQWRLNEEKGTRSS